MDNYEYEDDPDPFEDHDEEPEEGTTLLIFPIIKETPRAYLVKLRKDNKEYWFPKSQVLNIDDEAINITNWIAKQKDL